MSALGERRITRPAVVAGCLLVHGCGSRSALPDGPDGAASAERGIACPVRASLRLNAVGESIGPPLTRRCPDAPPPLPEPCPGTCGNGTVDDCALTANTVETCDGQNLGGLGCEALGFSGGSLECASCRFDPTACTDCAADPRVHACHHVEVGAAPFSTFALAVHDDRIAVAGFSRLPSGLTDGLRVVIFDSTFSRVAQTGCFDFSTPEGVAIASDSEGFVVAAANAEELDVYALSTDGVVKSGTRIARVRAPYLTENPTGGALLVYADGDTWIAALLDPSASPIWATPVFGPGYALTTGVGVDRSGVNAVYADRGFLISGGGPYIERVEMDGRATCLHRIADLAASTRIGWNGSDGLAVWSVEFGDSDPLKRGLYSAKLDRYGARTTEAVRFTVLENAPLERASFADGTSLVVSLGPPLNPPASTAYAPLPGHRIDGTWIDESGARLIPSAPLGMNGFGAGTPDVSRLGNDIVIGWLGQAVLPRDGPPAWLTLLRVGQ